MEKLKKILAKSKIVSDISQGAVEIKCKVAPIYIKLRGNSAKRFTVVVFVFSALIASLYLANKDYLGFLSKARSTYSMIRKYQGDIPTTITVGQKDGSGQVTFSPVNLKPGDEYTLKLNFPTSTRLLRTSKVRKIPTDLLQNTEISIKFVRCELYDPDVCDPEVVISPWKWGDEVVKTISNGSLKDTIPADFKEGVYKMAFKPYGTLSSYVEWTPYVTRTISGFATDISEEQMLEDLKNTVTFMYQRNYKQAEGFSIQAKNGEMFSTWEEVENSNYSNEEKAMYMMYVMCDEPLVYENGDVFDFQQRTSDQSKCYAAAGSLQNRLFVWSFLLDPSEENKTSIKKLATINSYLILLEHDRQLACPSRGDNDTVANVDSQLESKADLLLGDTPRARRYMLDNYVGTGRGIGNLKNMGLLDESYCSYLEGEGEKCKAVNIKERMNLLTEKIYEIKNEEGWFDPYNDIKYPSGSAGTNGWQDWASVWQLAGSSMAMAMNGSPDMVAERLRVFAAADKIIADSPALERDVLTSSNGSVTGSSHTGYFQHIGALLDSQGYNLSNLPELTKKAKDIHKLYRDIYWVDSKPIFKTDRDSYDYNLLVEKFGDGAVGECQQSGVRFNKNTTGTRVVDQYGESATDSLLGSFHPVYITAKTTNPGLVPELIGVMEKMLNVVKNDPVPSEDNACGMTWMNKKEITAILRQFAYLQQVYLSLSGYSVGRF